MSPDEHLQILKEAVITLAAFYDKQLSDDQVKMYAGALANRNLEDVRHAMQAVICDPKVQSFPLPGVVIAHLPGENQKANADIVASRILAAISDHGYTNPESARVAVGELGWAVVKLAGGWRNLCESMKKNELTAYRAQLRDLTQAVQSEGPDYKPALPQKRSSQGLVGFSDWGRPAEQSVEAKCQKALDYIKTLEAESPGDAS